MTSILLWQPTKGSEKILDLIYHPKKGSFALAKDELKENAALLETRHIFVGFQSKVSIGHHVYE